MFGSNTEPVLDAEATRILQRTDECVIYSPVAEPLEPTYRHWTVESATDSIVATARRSNSDDVAAVEPEATLTFNSEKFLARVDWRGGSTQYDRDEQGYALRTTSTSLPHPDGLTRQTTETFEMDYTPEGHLKSRSLVSTDGSGGEFLAWTRSMTYDNAGNCEQSTVASGRDEAALLRRHEYDDDRLSNVNHYRMDSEGNPEVATSTAYSYDSEDRLVTVLRTDHSNSGEPPIAGLEYQWFYHSGGGVVLQTFDYSHDFPNANVLDATGTSAPALHTIEVYSPGCAPVHDLLKDTASRDCSTEFFRPLSRY